SPWFPCLFRSEQRQPSNKRVWARADANAAPRKKRRSDMSSKVNRAVLFTQQDVVTVFAPPPPGSPFGVRVGTVTGAINGTITVNTLLIPAPPGATFTGDDRALVIDTDGDQILFNVSSNGVFIQA